MIYEHKLFLRKFQKPLYYYYQFLKEILSEILQEKTKNPLKIALFITFLK